MKESYCVGKKGERDQRTVYVGVGARRVVKEGEFGEAENMEALTWRERQKGGKGEGE